MGAAAILPRAALEAFGSATAGIDGRSTPAVKRHPDAGRRLLRELGGFPPELHRRVGEPHLRRVARDRAGPGAPASAPARGGPFVPGTATA
jgi:hypothetical protein